MDMDAVSLGLYDYEMWLFRKIKKMLYFSYFIYDCCLREIIHAPSIENCFVSKEEETSNIGKSLVDS